MVNYMIIRFFPTLILCPPARQHLLESPFLNQKILSSKRKEQLSQMAVTFIRKSLVQSVSHIIHK